MNRIVSTFVSTEEILVRRNVRWWLPVRSPPDDFNFSHFTWLRVFFLPALDVCIGRHTAMTAQACKGGNVCMCLRFMRSGGWSGGSVCVCVVNHY